MPAELVSGFFGSTDTGERWAAWHGLGTVIDRPVVDTAEAITLAGLDWNVLSLPVLAQLPSGQMSESSNMLAQVREDTGEILGTVSKGYHTVQNTERFAFMDDLLASDEAKWHTAGVLRGGRQVWMLAKLTRDVKIAGLDDELVNMYLLLSDGTEGSSSMKVAVTPVRVVCTNTCRLALSSSPRMWAARHTSGLEGRMTEARETLQLTYSYIAAFEQTANELVEAKLSPSGFKAFLEQLVPLPVGKDPSDRSWKSATEKRAAIDALYRTSENLENVRGTKWAAVQAVGEFSDWYGGRGAGVNPSAAKLRLAQENAWGKRMSSSPTDLKDTALKLLVR